MQELDNLLREQRIKKGTDYSWTHKYGRLHILCDAIWVDEIREAAESLQIPVHGWHTY